jgi:hypothetical protein
MFRGTKGLLITFAIFVTAVIFLAAYPIMTFDLHLWNLSETTGTIIVATGFAIAFVSGLVLQLKWRQFWWRLEGRSYAEGFRDADRDAERDQPR